MGGWPRIAGLRVVMSWPDSEFAPAPPPRGRGRTRLAGFTGACLVFAGVIAMLVAALSQRHAPVPAASAAGTTGPGGARGPSLHHSLPVSVAIPTIGVKSRLLHLGRNQDGTMEVPNLFTSADEAAWYKYSVTPGQLGTSVIEGHVDSYQGPAIFYRLGALKPGNRVSVTLADGITAVFRVTGVREYAKDKYPANTIYGPVNYAALRLITCGGGFDAATGHYLSAVVVFASLVSSSHRLRRHLTDGGRGGREARHPFRILAAGGGAGRKPAAGGRHGEPIARRGRERAATREATALPVLHK